MPFATELPRRTVLSAATAAALAGMRPARAQTPTIKIGVLTDMTGPYRDNGGPTSVVCAKQAVQDSGIEARGVSVEIVVADHQNKSDIGLNVAREWFDRAGVDAIAEINNSSIALAINTLVTERNKVSLASGAGAIDLTGSGCSPNMVQWQSDTWMDAQIAAPVVAAGGDKWFMIVSDYTSGRLLGEYTEKMVLAAKGSITGTAIYPFPDTTDFSSFLLRAQASGANVIAFSNAGADLVNCIKQAHEFGLSGMKLVGLVTFITNVHTLGLDVAQGLLLTEAFYWDLNDRTRRFLDRVKAKTPNNYPNSEHAGCYSAVLHYLKAVSAVGVPQAKKSGLDVVQTMKRMPTDDDCFGVGSIRADGRKVNPLYTFQVKTPAESRSTWDVYKLIDTIPPERAIRPIDDGGCRLTPGFQPKA